jgi:hypothetical protein
MLSKVTHRGGAVPHRQGNRMNMGLGVLPADLRRPCGADHAVGAGFPTLKRGANKPCAYGAV